MNHEECCQRAIATVWPGGPLGLDSHHRPGPLAHDDVAGAVATAADLDQLGRGSQPVLAAVLTPAS